METSRSTLKQINQHASSTFQALTLHVTSQAIHDSVG